MTVGEAAYSNEQRRKKRALAQRKSQRLTRVPMLKSLSIVASCECDSTQRSGL
jgi:hypothetical protein